MYPKRHIKYRRIEERSRSITMMILHEVVVLHKVLVLSRSQGIGQFAHIDATNLNSSHHWFCPCRAVTICRSVIADIRAQLGIAHTIRLANPQRVLPCESQQFGGQIQSVFNNLIIRETHGLRFDSSLQFLREIIESRPSITCLHKRYRHKHHDRNHHRHPNRHISNYLLHNKTFLFQSNVSFVVESKLLVVIPHLIHDNSWSIRDNSCLIEYFSNSQIRDKKHCARRQKKLDLSHPVAHSRPCRHIPIKKSGKNLQACRITPTFAV